MYIGKVSELTGASRKAIHLYESLGLIPKPNRKGKYRVYTEIDIAVIKLIRRAQTVGFSLAELKEITAVKAERNGFPIDMANRLIDDKRESLRKDMDKIMLLDQQLVDLKEELKRNLSRLSSKSS